MAKVAYLGPNGSYSEVAAGVLCPDAEYIACVSFRKLFAALESGEADYIVLPVENSLNGGVNQNLDLLQSADGVFAFKECAVRIDHRLATLAGANPALIKRIYSHQQALEQCGEYLFKRFPDAKLSATQSTSASLDMIKTPYDAGIVGSHIRRENISLSAENIADEKDNYTYFLLIKRGEPETGARSEKIFFTATCPHRPGALCDMLSRLSENGLNMTKIQSRPIKERRGEYRFFIEIEGDFADKKVRKALEDLGKTASSLKILGAY